MGREMFAPLKSPAFFKNVTIEAGGYAVSWGSEIDLSEHALRQHGEAMPEPSLQERARDAGVVLTGSSGARAALSRTLWAAGEMSPTVLKENGYRFCSSQEKRQECMSM